MLKLPELYFPPFYLRQCSAVGFIPERAQSLAPMVTGLFYFYSGDILKAIFDVFVVEYFGGIGGCGKEN